MEGTFNFMMLSRARYRRLQCIGFLFNQKIRNLSFEMPIQNVFLQRILGPIFIIKQWKKNKFCHFLVDVKLIHRLMQADICCTTTARLFFFPLLVSHPVNKVAASLDIL